MKKNKIFALCLSVLVSSGAIAQDIEKYPWLDTSKSFNERARLLCAELTLQEKVDQLGNLVTNPVRRNGVIILPSYQYWNEALHGVARSGPATSFPESKGMSATWDRQLIYDCAWATSDEARIYYLTQGKGLNYWSPTINMSRDPRWGRDEENYGEDPFLAGELGVYFIRGFQGEQTEENPYLKLVACVKHFAGNNYEQGRQSTTTFVTERNMREYYLPAFEMCVRDGHVKSLMAAYNAFSIDIDSDVNAAGLGPVTGNYIGVGGIPCAANPMLLTDILRKEWGFNGYVTSDCAGLSVIHRATKHLYFGPYNADNQDEVDMMEARSTTIAIKAGLNTNCEFKNQTSVIQRAGVNAVTPAFQAQDDMGYLTLTEKDIDKALIPLLESRFALGEFEKEDCPWNNVCNTLESEENQALALKAAQESITLLKNDGNLLPISEDKTIALIGPYANQIMLGDYSGTPTYTTTPFQAFSKAMNFTLNDGTIQFEDYDVLGYAKRGEAKFKGSTFVENTSNGDWIVFNDVNFGSGCRNFSVMCATKKGSGEGTINFYLDVDGNPSDALEPVLTISNSSIAAGAWSTYMTIDAEVDPNIFKGKHNVTVKFKTSQSYVGNWDWFRFYNEGADPMEETGPLYLYSPTASVNTKFTEAQIRRAAEIAAKADVAIFLGGTNFEKLDDHATGTESHDRWVLTLPGNQEDVLKAIYEANPNTVLVLESGSSLDITWANQNVPAIMEAWYGGQAQGQAICDAIFGKINPSGKITSTWYNNLDELPGASDSKFGRNGLMEYNIDEWGYTYMFYGNARHGRQADRPMYPFGYGLSYTTFEYSDMDVDISEIKRGQTAYVTATITNTGDRDGAEVVQLYANWNGRGMNGRMNKKLVGFERVELAAGESKTVTIPVKYVQLSYFDEDTHNYCVESGEVTLELAASSADVRLTAPLQTQAGVAKETYISEKLSTFDIIDNDSQLKDTDFIYNVMGAYVGQACDYNRLPAGIYVINGHKYVKKTR